SFLLNRGETSGSARVEKEAAQPPRLPAVKRGKWNWEGWERRYQEGGQGKKSTASCRVHGEPPHSCWPLTIYAILRSSRKFFADSIISPIPTTCAATQRD